MGVLESNNITIKKDKKIMVTNTQECKEILGNTPRVRSMLYRICRNINVQQKSMYIQGKKRNGTVGEVYAVINHFDIDEAIAWYRHKIDTGTRPKLQDTWRRVILDLKKVRSEICQKNRT